MSETRADSDGAGASKKPRVEESGNEEEHVSIMQMVSGHTNTSRDLACV
jgi:hypothetical protein